jgi:hypothetical protein
MKEFKDLEFVSMSDDFFGVDGVRARIDFPNGFGASVVRHNYSYGGPDGLYELGVTRDGELHYDNSVAEGDVQGYLDEEGVTELLKGIQLL